jgi:hypothetical protein
MPVDRAPQCAGGQHGDRVIYQDAYQTELNPDSEVVLIPKIGGG